MYLLLSQQPPGQLVVADYKIKKKRKMVGDIFIALIFYNCFLYYRSSIVYYNIYRYVLLTCCILACILLILLFGRIENIYQEKQLYKIRCVLPIGFQNILIRFIFFIFLISFIVAEKDYYRNVSPDRKYIVFMGISFDPCLLISVIYTKMTKSLY